MMITRVSMTTGIEHTVEIGITEEELYKVEHRHELNLPIQHIVPRLTASEREFLMTGIIDEEWDMVFPNE